MYETITLTPAAKKFWKTKKQKAGVNVTDKVTNMTSYWDGGSCDQWYTVTKSGQWNAAPGVVSNPFDRSAAKDFILTDDVAVVCAGIFRGSPRSVTIYVKSKEGWVF